ncbi:hypothetical protein NQ318_002488 [Aromia moschata]|uniref:Uncharacterized protein n=1 Tax=Aromia moschata TaxID=1265417 RepID=A0AAV8Y859_9CUCU|nr:hypothetical protein NQ318_002488 [Aromia moschata]
MPNSLGVVVPHNGSSNVPDPRFKFDWLNYLWLAICGTLAEVEAEIYDTKILYPVEYLEWSTPIVSVHERRLHSHSWNT